MQRYNVNLPPEVIAEIEHYVDIIALDSVTTALKWYQEIETKILSLDENPERCPTAVEDKYHDFKIRNLIFGNYRIIYRIEERTVQILHVKHRKMERRAVE